MFRELGATAPQTYYQFRTSNGTADVLYVLLESLTALGLQALFCSNSKSVGGSLNTARTLRLVYWRRARGQKKNENGSRRVTTIIRPVRFAADVRQKFFGISRGEFWWAIKKLRLYWFSWCFWELYKKWLFELQGWRTCFGTDLPWRWITYYKYS